MEIILAHLDWVTLGILVVGFIVLIILVTRKIDLMPFEEGLNKLKEELEDDHRDNTLALYNQLKSEQQGLKEDLVHLLQLNNQHQGERIACLDNGLKNDFEGFRKDEGDRYLAVVGRLEKLEEEVNLGLEKIRRDNNEKLEQMRSTVEEKLQDTLEKRISQSFEVVNAQLQQVYQGIGEMKNLATDVGGLKKILGNVKTRGILGEVQLAAILEEILSPEQYDKDVATIPGSSNRVEFAIHMPGKYGDFVYLPIDAKFPNDRYEQLLAAKDSGDREKIDAAYRDLENVVTGMAKDIHEKYIEEPHTTNFGIMFLASEGLYAEVVSRGLMQKLQRTYQITVAGPSTMAAFLNSLQMGFRTLAIEKRSSEVWELLGAVKAEFGKFEDGLKKMKRNIETTNNEIDELMGRRTRAINRKLRDVETIDFKKAEEKLEITDNIDEE